MHVVQLPYYSFGSHKQDRVRGRERARPPDVLPVEGRHDRPRVHQLRGRAAERPIREVHEEADSRPREGKREDVDGAEHRLAEDGRHEVQGALRRVRPGGDDSKSDKSSKSSKSGNGSDSDDGSNDDSDRSKHGSDDVSSPAARAPVRTRAHPRRTPAALPPLTLTLLANRTRKTLSTLASQRTSTRRRRPRRRPGCWQATLTSRRSCSRSALAAARAASDVVDVTGDASSSAKPQVQVKKEASESAGPPA
eukprot:7378038-Prymnesium_polylepis.1